MAKSKAIIAKSYLYMILLVIFISILIYINVYGQLNIPLIFEIKPNTTEEDFFQFYDLQDISNSGVSAYGEISQTINENSQNEYNIKTILTDENYPELYDLKIIGGSFFDNEMVEDKCHYVVISENLSRKIFPFSQAVGQTIYIDDFSYYIIGVYECDNSYWSRLSSDKYERIFIPYTTYPNYSNRKLTTIAIKNDIRSYVVIDSLKIKYPYLLHEFNQIDYKEKMECSTQFISLLITFIQIITILYILRFIYKMARDYVKELLLHKDEYYFGRLLIYNKRYLLALMMTLVVSIAIIVIIYKRLNLEVVMSSWFIPEENLFDLSHYYEKILSFFINENSRNIIGNNYLYKLSNMTLFSSIILSMFIYPCIILLISKFKKLIKANYVIALEMLAYLIVISIICFAINTEQIMHYIKSIKSVLIYFILLFITVFFNSIYEMAIKKYL